MAFPAPYNPQEWAPISGATGSPSPSAAGRFVHHRAFAGPGTCHRLTPLLIAPALTMSSL